MRVEERDPGRYGGKKEEGKINRVCVLRQKYNHSYLDTVELPIVFNHRDDRVMCTRGSDPDLIGWFVLPP